MKHRIVAWLLLILGMVICRAGFLEDVFYNIDEAEYAVAADAMNHGWLPGVDLLGSTKPPGIAVFYNLLFHIFERSISVLHIAHVVIMIATGALVVELAIALWGLASAIPSAVVYWMLSNTYEKPDEMLALNVESPGMFFAVAALCLAWIKPQARWALLASGLLLGVGTLFRQSILLFAAPMVVAVLFAGDRKVTRLIWMAAGALAAWLPVLLIYGASGNLGWAWDSWVRYPATYSGDTGLEGFFAGLSLYGGEFVMHAAVPLAMALGGLILTWREPDSRRKRFLLWLTGASVVALCLGSRFFGHYWIQLFPVMALLATAAWLHLAHSSRAARRLLTGAVIIGGVVAALHFATWRNWDQYAPPRGMGIYSLGPEQLERQIGEFAKKNTTPDETIAVWGYCPQIYYFANRLPGVRDYLCHYSTGYSPGTFDPTSERAVRSIGHPHALEMFVSDLERRKPKYVFDLVPVQDYVFPFYNYSLRDYPQIASYLRQNYLPEGSIGDAMIYRRRTSEDQWYPKESDVK